MLNGDQSEHDDSYELPPAEPEQEDEEDAMGAVFGAEEEEEDLEHGEVQAIGAVVSCAQSGSGARHLAIRVGNKWYGCHPVRHSASGEEILMALPTSWLEGGPIPLAPSGGPATHRVLAVSAQGRILKITVPVVFTA